MKIQTPTNCLCFFLFFLLSFSLYADQCDNPYPENGDFLHANNVRAFYAASGSSFYNGTDAQFAVDDPLNPLNQSIATFFAHGLWMGGYDAASNLKVAAAEYGFSSGNHDYYPGPLNEDGTVAHSICSNFDRTWSVYRYQVEAHVLDYADNGIVDNPIPAIMGWPAFGNDQFEAINGFALPNSSQGFAAFEDLNGNGSYEPLEGEYPRIEQTNLIPDQILWTVFNTRGNIAAESGSANQFSIEVQLTAWAFACTNSPILNNTTFSSYKIINRELEPIQDFRLALWTDFDLGCYVDDYIGSAPALNSHFSYNRDNIDDNPCDQGIVGAGENPPAQAITFLNRPLDYFNYYMNGMIAPEFPDSPGAPQLVQEYYNLMNGLFVDGTPITRGDYGYNPGSTEVASHVFPDDPNDADGWSARLLGLLAGEQRAVATTKIDELLPGSVHILDVAYSYHREPDSDNLDNVTNMYANITDVQVLYDNGFVNVCAREDICEGDCVWAGDLNADGIANHEDFIANYFYGVETGPTRMGPYNWTPQGGLNWAGNQLNGNDKKHLDANGDGVSNDAADFEITIQHYNRTRPDYVPVSEYREGDDIVFTRIGANGSTTGLSLGESFFARVELATDMLDLRALAYTLEYDPLYFQEFKNINTTSISDVKYLHNNPAGQLDFSTYMDDANSYLMPGSMFTLQIRIAASFPEPTPSDETYVRFRNIRAYLSDGSEVELGAHEVVLQIADLMVATEEPEWAQDLTLFPNPVTDRLHLQTNNVRVDDLQLFDGQGREMRITLQSDDQLDVSQLSPGIYYLRIFSEGDFVARKFVKTK